jgi:acyl-CoA dehydrogenase
MTGLLVLALLGTSLFCAYIGTRLVTWTAVMAAVLIVFAAGTSVPVISVAIVTVLLGIVAVPLNIPTIRQRYLSAPFLKQYLRMLPSLSDTEATALRAGTVGWEGELFAGKPDWKVLRDMDWPELTMEEQAYLDGPVEQLCGMLNEWEITHEYGDLPENVWQFLKREKFFGMIIPKDYGGLGFSALAHRAVLQKVASVSTVAGATVAVPNSLGPAELILHYGTEEQKNHYLPRLAVGKEIPCFGLTAPTAGSDATSIPDYGIVCRDKYKGKDVLGVRMTFDKRYITLAPVATVIGVAFRLYDPDGLLGENEDRGISLALVPRDTKNLKIGTRHQPMDVPFMNGPVRGKDVFIPVDALIGGAEMVGKGWRMLIESLSVGRSISLPSCSTGGVKAGALATGAYARIRKQFNMPIGRFEGVEEGLARIAGRAYATSALSRMTAIAVDLGEKPAVPSAIAKSNATEYGRQVITAAMDIHGGKGVILGPRNYLGRAWQGAPIWITVEGANILTRSMMIFGQGAIRCHPYVLKEMEAARNLSGFAAVKEFDRQLFGHVGYSIRNAVRSLLLGLSFGHFTTVPHDRKTARYYRKLTRYSATLAFTSDMAMLTLGGKLKQKEKISGRLADVLSQLYICSAMLKRFEEQGRPAADQPILAWAFHDSIYQMQVALAGVVDNFPNRWLRGLLSLIVFPFGRREKPAGDRLGHRVSQLLLAPSETRDRLTHGIYRSARHGHQIGLMEEALPLVIAAEPLERRMLKALKAGQLTALTFEARVNEAAKRSILTEAEAQTMREVHALVWEIISVDEFDPDAFGRVEAPQQDLRPPHAA